MSRTHRCTAVPILLALLTLATPARPLHAQRARLHALFRAVDSVTTPGCVVGIDSAGTRWFTGIYGQQDLERSLPIDTNTVFEAGSVSKQLTAAAVVLLSLEGRLSIDDNIRKWVPELPDYGDPITIRHLLAHQSGLRDYGNLFELSGWPRGTRAYSMADALTLLSQQRALNFRPGREYSYSNSNYVVAAIIIERVSGLSFQQYSERAIFAPLGMRHTRWRTDYTAVIAHRAIAFTPTDSGFWHLDMPFENVVGHGGLLTTVPDLLRWLRNLDAPTVGGARFAQVMQQAVPLRTGRATAYAMGLEINTLGGEPMISHAGATAGYRAWAGRLPERALSAAVLCNAGSLNTEALGPQVISAAASLPAPDYFAEPQLGAAVPDGPGAALAGLYRSERTNQTVRVRAYERGLTLNSWTGYTAENDGSFRSDDGVRVLRAVVADGLRRIPSSASDIPRLRIRIAADDSIDYVRVESWSPVVSTLRAFTGTYRSSEAGAEWHVLVVDDSLVIERRPGQRDVAQPIYRDAFSVPGTGWTLRFRRDTRGRVTAVDVGITRMRRLTMRRDPSPQGMTR